MRMTFAIAPDDLRDDDVRALLLEHLDGVRDFTPDGCVHALDVDGLRAPGVTFYTVREEGVLVGCGALREIDPIHGELKSMRTAAAHLRRGVASALLEHLIAEARTRGYRRLSLETGNDPSFEPAQALYARFGFERCARFADYPDHPFSVFMTREIEEAHP